MSDTQPTSTYQFVPAYVGQTLTADDYGKAVTADNLTDEDAEHFIAKGFGHVFQRIGAAVEGVGASIEGLGNNLASDEDNDQPSERELELAAQVQQLQTEYASDRASYEADVELARNALATEQQAHTATQAQLSQVQQQLADSQAALALATAPKAAKKAAPVTVDTPASPAAPADATQTGSN